MAGDASDLGAISANLGTISADLGAYLNDLTFDACRASFDAMAACAPACAAAFVRCIHGASGVEASFDDCRSDFDAMYTCAHPPRPCGTPVVANATAARETPSATRVVTCRLTADASIDSVYVDGERARVRSANMRSTRTPKVVEFVAPPPPTRAVLAIRASAPEGASLPASGGLLAEGGLIIACRSDAAGWRALASSARAAGMRVYGNDDGAPPGGADRDATRPAWAAPGFDERGWQLAAPSQSRVICPDCGLSSSGAAPAPVWFNQMTRRAFFRISPEVEPAPEPTPDAREAAWREYVVAA